MARREGTMLGPYRLIHLLGSGGAGEVYVAEGPTHSGASEKAAVKVLRGGPGDPTTIDVLRQARIAANPPQAHVLPVYHIGDSGDTVYIAMAYGSGGSLGAAVQAERGGKVQLPLGPGVVARFVGQVARALQAMHQRGLVHGDLKPNNLFVRTAPHGGPMVAISDFGQAVVVRAAAAALATGEQTWAPSALLCAAPEQLSGAAVPSSDQYALAVIAYFLLTGRYPFSGNGPALAAALLHEPPPSPARFDPALSSAAEGALMRALAKTPAARFPDIITFAQALDDGLAASAVARAGVTQEFAALAGSSRLTAPPAGGPRRPTRGPLTGPDAADAASHAPISGGGMPAGRAPHEQPRARGLAALSPRQRLLASIAGVLLLALVVAGGFGLRALFAGSANRPPLPNFGGLNYAPTVTPNATQVARFQALAQAAEQRLAAATAGQPVFSDDLASNANHWAVDGKESFFGTDKRLHLFSHSIQSVYSLNQPGAAPGDCAVRVDMTFVQGSLSDLAGLRLRVAADGDGHASFATVLFAPDGRYEVWRYDGSHWQVLDFGYAAAMHRGLGQTNTLAVLARGASLDVFINGHFVTSVQDSSLTPTPGMTMGPTVIYSGTEVAYAHYAVYAVAG